MRRTTAAVAAAGTLLAGGVVGAALTAGGIATAAGTPTPAPSSSATVDADRLAHRTAELKEALAGLVKDGTITQAQADKVASTLATNMPRGRGGPGPGPGHGPRMGTVAPATVAKILGITEAELRTQHEAGKTLAQIAAAEGLSKADLISKLVAAAKAELATAVKEGRLTQAQADQISANLQARITEHVDRVPGEGPGGPRMGRGMGPAMWGADA